MSDAFKIEAQKSVKIQLLISMAVPASLEYTQKGFDLRTLNRYVDFFNMLTYDYHASNEPFVYHHAPLFSPGNDQGSLSIKKTVDYYLKNGVSRY